MSSVSFMEKLLDGVEIEWKLLGDVGEVTKLAGYEFTKHVYYSDSGKIIALRGLNVKNGSLELKNVKYIDGSEFSKLSRSKLYRNDMLFTYVGTIGEVALVDEDDRYYLAPNVARIRFTNASINPVFMRYYFQTDDFEKSQIDRYLASSSMKNLTMANIRKFKIPIPCPEDPKKSLEIQAEIVRILDTFTELTAELTAELAARKKQYNYYRDKLLTFEEGEVEWKPLGEIGQVRMCKRILKSQTLPEGDIPFYKIGTFGKSPDSFISRSLFEKYKSKYSYPRTGEVLISASGTIGRTVIFDGADSYFQDSNIVWIENDERLVLNKFLFYFYQIANWGTSEGGTIKRLYNNNLRKLSIPIPHPNNPQKSLEEQARIVSILDNFDALTNSITEGLPREIELRQKQYEYYRDLLLSFPKPDEQAA
ncbi:restriction endonuclease subunit S [Methylophaga pinxianii]|uniref:restriction endonuclease subunit S n=1 Tax=Methylophaga pinxianii TaxID=2881052 RepID=UPI001CF1FABD|nr:restriction endonuclease subunit S [Methylophaga pinxianii]MCB2425821.1 restriction endonuclease subunit S [Methylophaga pinxianii]UPH47330.1 restriction endonuclease subunit S [Methylophaga pinxianii]